MVLCNVVSVILEASVSISRLRKNTSSDVRKISGGSQHH